MNQVRLIPLLVMLCMAFSCKNTGQKDPESRTNEMDRSQENTSREIQEDEDPQERLLSDLIQVETLQEGEEINFPLHIKGQARGMWFFEGDFPIYLISEDGEELAVAIAVAQGNWMTTEWVPFTATLEYEPEQGGEGFLVFEKSNPSDKRELDRELRISVSF